MRSPPDHFKQAFNVALAMTIAYGIALAMDWSRPFWAGLAVAFASLPTLGQTINQGLQRILGTFLGGVLALALIGLFPQERWSFLISMSVVIAICTYLMGGRLSTLWFVAGFTLPIVAGVGGADGLNSFNIAVLRTQETALGVIAYTVVAMVFWPKTGGADFERDVGDICRDQSVLFHHHLRRLTGDSDEVAVDELRARLDGALAGIGPRLEGARYDRPAINAARHAWRGCVQGLSAFGKAMSQWRLGLTDSDGLDLERVMPNLRAFGAQVVDRLAASTALLEGGQAERAPGVMSIQLDLEEMGKLSPFQRAAVLRCRDELVRMDLLAEEILTCAQKIRGGGRPEVSAHVGLSVRHFWVIDNDRLLLTLRQAAALWAALLLWIYVDNVPVSVALIALTNAFAMAFTNAPFVPFRLMLAPTVMASLYGGMLYMFVMPHLDGFSQLGLLIFAATFLICFVFHTARMALAKAMGLCMLVIMLGVSNEQSYSFLYFSNWFMTGVLFVVILMATSALPVSFRPEHRFVAILRRFARSAQFLVSPSRHATTWLSRWRRAFHLREVTTLPQKLQTWSKSLTAAVLGATSREDVQSLVQSVQRLSEQAEMLADVESLVQSNLITHDVLAEMRAWHGDVRETLDSLAADPGRAGGADARERTEARIARLGSCVERAFDHAGEAGVATDESAQLYQLLGAYRGVSEGLSDFVRRLASIDWERLRAPRF